MTTSPFHISFGLWHKSSVARSWPFLFSITLIASFSSCHFHKHQAEQPANRTTNEVLGWSAVHAGRLTFALSDTLFSLVPSISPLDSLSTIQTPAAGRFCVGRTSFETPSSSAAIPVAIRHATISSQRTDSIAAKSSQTKVSAVDPVAQADAPTKFVIFFVVLFCCILPAILLLVLIPFLMRILRV